MPSLVAAREEVEGEGGEVEVGGEGLEEAPDPAEPQVAAGAALAGRKLWPCARFF